MPKTAKAKATSTTSKVKGKGKEEETNGKKPKVLPTRKAIDAMKMAIPVIIDGQQLVGTKKQFKKGSTGFNVSGKVVIDGLPCQVSANIVVVGSKDLAKSEGFEVGGEEEDSF